MSPKQKLQPGERPVGVTIQLTPVNAFTKNVFDFVRKGYLEDFEQDLLTYAEGLLKEAGFAATFALTAKQHKGGIH